MSGPSSAVVGSAARALEPSVALHRLLPLPDRSPGYAGYLGLLFFTLVIITYRVPGADVAAVVAAGSVLLGLLLGHLRLRWGVAATALVVVLALAAFSSRDSIDPPWPFQRTLELA